VFSEGNLLHRFAGIASAPHLSPDGERLAFQDAAGRPVVRGLGGTTTALPAALRSVEGWVDADTLIGATGGELSGELVDSPAAPYGHAVAPGVRGEFIGTIVDQR
jgi:hypothetical protein